MSNMQREILSRPQQLRSLNIFQNDERRKSNLSVPPSLPTDTASDAIDANER